jgi:hypothetical protein
MAKRLLLGATGAVLLACAAEDRSPAAAADTARRLHAPVAVRASCQDTSRTLYPSVRWTTADGLRADLDYDGEQDVVMWGHAADTTFLLTIARCNGERARDVWSFPTERGLFDTVNLEVATEDPSRGEGYFAENCLGAESPECVYLKHLDSALSAAYARGGVGLSIGVPDRDHIHIYWEADSARFATWRP